MDTLPIEILSLILGWNVRMCCENKNTAIELRSVCKAFDVVLKPLVFKTIKLEFSKFLRHKRTPSVLALERVGGYCEFMYLDMMVVRDEDEIARLEKIFKSLMSKVPEMMPILESLREYCMSESTFEQCDFRRVLEGVFFQVSKCRRLRINLPFQVIGSHSRPATIILATTLAVLAKRSEEDTRLEGLVLDHVSDSSIMEICQNPMDLANAIEVFGGLKNLIMSVKRRESGTTRQATFTQNLWFLIRKATKLESLCLIGWNVKRDIKTRKYSHGVSLNCWTMRSLPFLEDPLRRLDHLRFLELKRVDIDPECLLGIIKQSAHSLKEIYLYEVYLKVHGGDSGNKNNLWIGQPRTSKPENSCWIAEDLREMEGLNLDIVRATGLGYDDYAPLVSESLPDYDLEDPSGRNRSFDCRFVEKVLGLSDDSAWSIITNPENENVLAETKTPERAFEEYDAETFQKYHNTTSHFKRYLDGIFFNKNEGALKELQKVIEVADRGMSLLSEEIFNTRNGDIEAAGAVTGEGVPAQYQPHALDQIAVPVVPGTRDVADAGSDVGMVTVGTAVSAMAVDGTAVSAIAVDGPAVSAVVDIADVEDVVGNVEDGVGAESDVEES